MFDLARKIFDFFRKKSDILGKKSRVFLKGVGKVRGGEFKSKILT